VKLLTADQAAKLLLVSTQRVYELVRLGIIPCVKLGRQVRFDEETLTEWVRNGGQSLPGIWKREA
jgi:excisionase family DNA binding protein